MAYINKKKFDNCSIYICKMYIFKRISFMWVMKVSKFWLPLDCVNTTSTSDTYLCIWDTTYTYMHPKSTTTTWQDILAFQRMKNTICFPWPCQTKHKSYFLQKLMHWQPDLAIMEYRPKWKYVMKAHLF